MKNHFALVLASLIICSCQSESPEIGSDFFRDGSLDFSFIDSCTVKLSTIQLDEMATNSASRILLGTHQDERLGKITASSYFQLIPSGSINLKDEDVTYEYLSLVLYPDEYSYYDTLTPVTLNVHRVTEDIIADDGVLYNTSEFKTAGESLGSIRFKPRPHEDSIEIRLSDTLGKELFQYAKNGGDQLTTTNFLKYFQGLAILPDTTESACFFGVTTNPTLKVHYVDRSATPPKKESFNFDVNTASNLYFTKIACDRKLTRLNAMPATKERLNSTITNNEAYLQAGAGLALRIDLPYLRSLKQLSNFYVTQAILEIFPVRKSSGRGASLPAELDLFKADKRNSIYQQVEEKARLIEDLDLARSTHYRLDVTEFVKDQMELQSFNENGLIFTTANDTYPVSVDRVYTGAPSFEYKTRLKIYFATVNN